MSDRKCPLPECPEHNYTRRQDDAGLQVILQAIGGLERSTAAQTLEMNQRLGRMESNIAKTAERIGAHSGEIENLKAASKSRMDKKWLLVSAFIGATTTLLASALNVFKAGK